MGNTGGNIFVRNQDNTSHLHDLKQSSSFFDGSAHTGNIIIFHSAIRIITRRCLKSDTFKMWLLKY